MTFRTLSYSNMACDWLLDLLQMEINLKGQIVILDEAHNIEDSAREAASQKITQEQIQKALHDMDVLSKTGVHVCVCVWGGGNEERESEREQYVCMRKGVRRSVCERVSCVYVCVEGGKESVCEKAVCVREEGGKECVCV